METHAKKNTGICAPESTDFISLLMHFPSHAMTALKAWNKNRETRLRDRRAIEYLRTLNDNNLRDIGISKDDVNWAGNLPPDQSATSRLQRIARRKHKFIQK